MECANCGRSYSAYSPANAQWCGADHVYFCRKCVGTGARCPSCGRKLSRLGSQLLTFGVILTVMFGLVAATILPVEVDRAQLEGLSISPVSSLSPGSTAKISGYVSAGQGTVIVIFSYKDSTGTPQTGRHVEPFWMNDSTGRVLVEMGSNGSTDPAIDSGGVPYPSNATPTGF
jgi:hypothetical protein